MRELAANAAAAIRCQEEDRTQLVVTYLQALLNLVQ